MESAGVKAATGIEAYRRLVTFAGFASVATGVAFVFVKLAVWLLSGSSSMFASLTDSVFDSLAALINLVTLRYSLMPADREHRYGHFKAQALASLAQAAFIGGSAVLLVVHGIDKFRHPQEVENALVALGVSGCTIALTLILVSFQGYVYRKTRSELVYADRFHYISDIGLNLGVMAALALSFYGHLWADGMFAAIIGVLILRGAWKIGYDAANTLVDKTLEVRENQEIMRALLTTPGVRSLHDLKTRKAGPQYFIQCHLVLDPKISLQDAHAIASAAERSVRASGFAEADISLHMEPDSPETAADAKVYAEDLEKGEKDAETRII
ncbi:MAG: cation diffusion facilitator family transporter [Aeromonadales bacterium]|nr:cation diffusion facilitator family transporter [Aeromonadales bacterium]MDY2891392.1 cation diffusion facilitator family transporter [Succinivibrio sp.]